ncbi:MAG: MXAN_6521/LA_1396 family lipoprotein [Leptospirales bacterium]|nr:MXAN_6521/LA_1396 family lipoprotein [Leptospirales bacterium]
MRKFSSRLVLLILFGLLALTIDCASAVKSVYKKPGLETNELKYVKRVAVLVDQNSVPTADQAIRDRMLIFRTREHLIHHSEFIVYSAKPGNILNVCKAEKKLNGVLLHRLSSLKQDGGDLNFAMTTGLYDCKTGDRLWEAGSQVSYEMNDSDFGTLIAGDVKRFGESARVYSAPFYRLIAAVFEKLPNPDLTDAEKLEKIDADAN